MRRTASEVIRELEMRIARLEREAVNKRDVHDEDDFREMLENWSLEELAEYFVTRHFREVPQYGPIQITQQKYFDKELHAIGRTLSMDEQRPFMSYVDRYLGTKFHETREMRRIFINDIMVLAQYRALNKNLSPEEIQSLEGLRYYMQQINATGAENFDRVLKILAKKRRALEGWKRRNS